MFPKEILFFNFYFLPPPTFVPCGILVPGLGIEPETPAVEAQSLPLGLWEIPLYENLIPVGIKIAFSSSLHIGNCTESCL